jgi:hypothetical protein
MYSSVNYKSKKALKEALETRKRVVGESSDIAGIGCFQPGPFGPDVPDGWHTCEGPHYPEPHRWYARVRVLGGLIVEIAK